MNQPKTQLEQYDSQIKEIFTLDKLPAISAVINALRRTAYGDWIKEDQFKTIVNAATNQAIDDLQKDLTHFVVSNSSLPNTPK
jgi:hypothetical protein